MATELLPTLPGHIAPKNHGKPVTSPALTLSQLDAAIGRYIVDTYHRRVHPETGQTPDHRWLAGGWLPRMPDSAEALDLLLLTVTTPRKVQRDGIRCHGLRYFSLTLAAFVGEEVTIRYDPRDLAEVRVFHHGAFLCRAVAPEIAATTVSLKDLQAARNQRRRELRQQLVSRRSVVDILTHPAPASAVTTAPAAHSGDAAGTAEPDNQDAKDLQADAYEQMGYQTEAPQWRGIFLTAARELREGVIKAAFTTASPDTLGAMPLDVLFDFAGVHVIGNKAVDTDLRIDFTFTDLDQTWTV